MALRVAGAVTPWKAVGRAAFLGSVSRQGAELSRDSQSRSGPRPHRVSAIVNCGVLGSASTPGWSCFALGTLV